MICGNLSRINSTKILTPSENWKKFDKITLELFEKKASWLNRYFEYK